MRSFEEILDTIDLRNHANFNRKNFLIYLKYMMLGGEEPDVEVHEYYRYIYKHIEMIWEEEWQQSVKNKPRFST